MNSKKKRYMPRLAAVCAVVVLVVALASVAYAADVGGIQRQIQIWINGDQTDAVLDIRGGSTGEYSVQYQDADGVSHEIHGGGVAIGADGSERPLTEAEILDHLDSPNVEYREDGTVWVCYRDGKTAITDKFDENGICYVQIETADGPLYLTVRYQDGFASSPHHYVDPGTFSTEKN